MNGLRKTLTAISTLIGSATPLATNAQNIESNSYLISRDGHEDVMVLTNVDKAATDRFDWIAQNYNVRVRELNQRQSQIFQDSKEDDNRALQNFAQDLKLILGPEVQIKIVSTKDMALGVQGTEIPTK